MIAMFSVYV